MVGMLGQARVVHLGDVAVTGQELNDLLGVLDMTVNAQRQSLGALEQDPGVERLMQAPSSRSRIART